jgi:hypothetical protein
MYRQSVISIFKANSSGGYNALPDINVIHRQPYHDFGLAYSFNFGKSYFSPITDCQILINNPADEITESLDFEYSKPKTRPLIRIYAGYTDFKLESPNVADINNLIAKMNQVYSGFPFYFSDDKTGGANRELSIDLTDTSLIASQERISTTFSKNTAVIEVLRKLLNESGAEFDITALEQNTDFATQKIEYQLLYNSRFILEDLIPGLEKQYGFLHYSDPDGKLIFKAYDDQGKTTGAPQEINYDNGLIGFANTLDWVNVGFSTLFGQPDIFFPGDRISLNAPNLNPNKPTDGLILEANYSYADTEAQIDYVINKFGQVANSKPFLKV